MSSVNQSLRCISQKGENFFEELRIVCLMGLPESLFLNLDSVPSHVFNQFSCHSIRNDILLLEFEY